MGDRNEPTWVDYGNLAANMIQVGQLSNVQARLKDLAQIEAAREERGRLENQLRQFVFDLEGSTSNLKEHLQDAPRGVVVAAGLITQILDAAGVQPSTFQEFVDKDRVRSYRQYIAQLKADGSVQLKAKEIAEIDEILPLVVHAVALENLIAALEAKQELERTMAGWSRLEEKRQRESSIWNLLILFGLCATPILFFWAFVTTNSSQGDLLCLISVGTIIGAVIGLVNRANAITPEYRAMESYRQSLQAKLLSNEKYQETCKIFGEGLTLEEYRGKSQAIAAFLEKSLKQDKHGNPLPEPILWELPPPSGT